MKIGSDICQLLSDDDDVSTTKVDLTSNLRNYNKDGSPETPYFTWVGTLEGEEVMRGQGYTVNGIYLVFDYICLSIFYFHTS